MKDAREILTPALAETYARDGVVRLPGAIPRSDAEAMAAALRRTLAVRQDKGPRPSKLSSRTGAFAAMASPAVRGVLDDLLGDWEEPAQWGLPLVSFHTGEPVWDVPWRHWHIDFGRPGTVRMARVFAVLAPSLPGGGGTGYVAGSHRLIQRVLERADGTLASADVRRRLEARSPWFAALSSPDDREDRVRRLMAEGAELDGVQVRMCEMLGEPGDVIVMHPLMLHAPTPNVLATPRMMLTQFVYGLPTEDPRR